MSTHQSFSIRIRRLATKVLKPTRVGRWLYPYIQAVWRKYVIPYRRRRLQKHGWDCLNRLHQTLTSANIKYHCDFGTLLGLIRDRGFIPHDDDIDITIPTAETKSPVEILKILLAHGYQYLHGFQYEGRKIEFTIIDKTGITIDIFFPTVADENQKIYSYEPLWLPEDTYPSENANTLIRYMFVDLTFIASIKTCGIEVCIPANAEERLASEYGVNWRIPDSGFICSEECDNVKLPGFAFRITEDEFLSGE